MVQLYSGPTLFDRDPEVILCRLCGAPSVVRYGFTEKHKQRRLCLSCHRTFLDNDNPQRMRYSTEVITAAINRFFEGRSIREIQDQLDRDFQVFPHYSSINDWILHYTRRAVEAMEQAEPITSDSWVADETTVMLKFARTKFLRIFDCIDAESGFLLASNPVREKNGEDVAAFMKAVEKRTAGKRPEIRVTDNLKQSLQTFDPDQFVDTFPLWKSPSSGKNSSSIIKRLNGTFEERTDIIRNMTNPESINLVISGWVVHYNFFYHNPGLNGSTPADLAGASMPSKSWEDIVRDDHL